MKNIRTDAIVTDIYESPIGPLTVMASDVGVLEIVFPHEGEQQSKKQGENPILAACVSQLAEYFEGGRTAFDIPLDLHGTHFQLSVWRTLLLIACGETWSYGKVARHIGREKAVRAVGGANHNNPVSIIVPCHRVVGSDGKLTGYGGGLWRKEWLLEHEKKIAKG